MILLIGATGATGRETAQALAGRGAAIRALVRNRTKASALQAAGIELEQGDAAGAEALERSLRGVGTVFISTNAEPGMVEFHNRIIDAAKAAGARRIVKVSALGAHPGAKFRFAALHGAGDRYLQSSGLEYTILRPAYFMQNFLASASAIAQMDAIHLPIAGGRVALIDTRDIGAVAAAVLAGEGHANKIYDLTGSDSLTGAEMAAMMSRVVGREIRFISPDPEEFRGMLLRYAVPEWNVGGILEMFAIFAKGAASGTTGHVEAILGRPPIRFEQFIRDHAGAFTQAPATV